MNFITLSLYIPRQNTLDVVLENYWMYSYSGEWDMRCNGDFQQESSVILIDKLQTNKFNNLIIKTKSNYTESELINEECLEKVKSEAYSTKLIYNGKRYISVINKH